ncbi:MAG: hypothetical protein ACW99H_10710 [Candidatus Thorarchaeota archaeon]
MREELVENISKLKLSLIILFAATLAPSFVSVDMDPLHGNINAVSLFWYHGFVGEGWGVIADPTTVLGWIIVSLIGLVFSYICQSSPSDVAIWGTGLISAGLISAISWVFFLGVHPQVGVSMYSTIVLLGMVIVPLLRREMMRMNYTNSSNSGFTIWLIALLVPHTIEYMGSVSSPVFFAFSWDFSWSFRNFGFMLSPTPLFLFKLISLNTLFAYLAARYCIDHNSDVRNAALALAILSLLLAFIPSTFITGIGPLFSHPFPVLQVMGILLMRRSMGN